MTVLSVNLATLAAFNTAAGGAVGEFESIVPALVTKAGTVSAACSPDLQGEVGSVVTFDRSAGDLRQLLALSTLVHDEVEAADTDGDGRITLSLAELTWLHVRAIATKPPDSMARHRTADDIEAVLELYRAADVHPSEYADLLQHYYVLRAYERAGITNPGAWDPTAGYAATEPYLDAVYTYYGDLYLDDPDLQWAGMAGMIGPSFAAGMADLGMFRTGADALSLPTDDLPGWMQDAVELSLPPGLRDLNRLANMSAEEFGFYETALLSMQKEIFHDQAPMHEAYLEGGVAAIEELQAAGLIGPDMTDAWRDIASGDPARVETGNFELLRREQQDIIQDDYDRMRNRPGTGEAMTYLMGAIGMPSIPGADPLAAVHPLRISAEVGPPVGAGVETEVTVTTPLPDGNIASYGTRWSLIEENTHPAFVELLEEDPDLARRILETDFLDRLDDSRLINSVDDIAAQLLDWRVDTDTHLTVGIGPWDLDSPGIPFGIG